MPQIGYHVSSSGGYVNAVNRAIDYELETFQLFLGSPRTWNYRDMKENESREFRNKVHTSGFDTVVTHMNYLPNPSTPSDDRQLRENTIQAFNTEVRRADNLGIQYAVFHIGSHKGRGFQSAKPMVAQTINQAFDLDPEVILCLETSAGGTNSVGSTFEEIASILDLVDRPQQVGVCFDTCHVFAAGYDLRSPEKVNEVLDTFDEVIGLDKLQVFHVNDSKGELGAGKDRHEHIGKGHIGIDGFKALLHHPVAKNKPMILETPSKGVRSDINTLKRLRDDIQSS